MSKPKNICINHKKLLVVENGHHFTAVELYVSRKLNLDPNVWKYDDRHALLLLNRFYPNFILMSTSFSSVYFLINNDNNKTAPESESSVVQVYTYYVVGSYVICMHM